MDNVQKVCYFKNLELFNYVLSPNIRTLDSYERIKNGVVMIFLRHYSGIRQEELKNNIKIPV
jgi:hypothetical protein